jgi:7-carboxy-7-deazaguanine synthase
VLRISEVYPSFQGEGAHVGKPTVFVRFAGCNLRCPGWPCDTQHAIDAEKYRFEWERMSVATLLERIANVGIRHVCYTGGEPFLQPRADLEELTHRLQANDYSIECFSNGTLEYPTWALEMIDICMDWKLPGSGEDFAAIPRTSMAYMASANALRLAKPNDRIKFTVADEEDFKLAMERWKWMYRTTEVTCGAVWGKVTESTVAKWILEYKLPWRLNVQVHNYVWDREQRGI